MKSILLNMKIRVSRELTVENLVEVICEALLCTVAGLLFGLLFGGIGAKVHHDLPTIVRIATTTAAGGFLFGTGLIAFRNLFSEE